MSIVGRKERGRGRRREGEKGGRCLGMWREREEEKGKVVLGREGIGGRRGGEEW